MSPGSKLIHAALLFAGLAQGWSAVDDPQSLEFFEAKIRPVLVEHCYACHSMESKKAKGKLRLDTAASLRQGGESGPVLLPGKPEESLLIRALRYSEKDLQMPPPGEGRTQLPEKVVRDFEQWIRHGATDPRTEKSTATQRENQRTIPTEEHRRWWAYQPLGQPKIPQASRGGNDPGNELDAFIRAQLEKAGLAPNPPADKQTLIRRATFDLTGLPPKMEDVQAFLTDTSPDAFAKVINRLLDSPQYGERWGRHWLDVVRYTDYISPGGTADANAELGEAYLYRDWVVGAFNRDMPFDRFILYQVAGDKLPAPAGEIIHREGIIATGLLAIGAWDNGDADKEKIVSDIVDDQIDVVGKAFLGTTLSCARCHDHKFDPITQEDYYGLAGIFYSTRVLEQLGAKGAHTVQLRIPLAPSTQIFSREKSLLRLSEINERLLALATSPSSPATDMEKQALLKEKEELKKGSPLPRALGAQDGGTPGGLFPGIQDVPLHVRGSYTRLGPVVARRLPEFLAGTSAHPRLNGSGRLELAQWLASPENPLTARVAVNRLWQHHFGHGLVRSSNNFGKLGELPSHPELLDWLARRFIEGGWSMKKIHRLIMTSATYQQASSNTDAARERDPENRLLSRQNPRRLEAEAIRDAILFAAGKLDFATGGRAVENLSHPRRSLYISTIRNDRRNFSTLFDAANPEQIVESRTISTSPGQALFFMNSSFIQEQSRALAQRLKNDNPDPQERVKRTWPLLFSRPATEKELAVATTFLGAGKAGAEEVAWEDFIHGLLLTNEFLYVD